MNKKVPPIITINHKNAIDLMDDYSRTNETLILLKTLTVVGQDNIGKEINKFFDRILPENNSSDIFKINTSISNKTKDSKNKSLINNTLNKILNQKEEVTLKLNNNETKDIALILSVIFNKIKSKKKIKDYETFLSEIEKVKKKNFDISKYSITNNSKKKNNSLFSTISTSKASFSNLNSKSPEKKSSFNGFEIIDYDYLFKEFKEDENLIIPIECIILLKKFEIIKRIKLSIDNLNGLNSIDENTVRNNIFVLLNINWLFFNVMGIEIDLSNEEMYNDYKNLYNEKLIELSLSSKKNIRNTNYSGFYNNKRIFDPIHEIKKNDDDLYENLNESGKNDLLNITEEDKFVLINKSNEIMNYDTFLKKYNYIFELIIIYSYFVSKIKNLLNFDIIIPDEMEMDIVNYLRKNGIDILNFQFLTFFFQTSNLVRFTCDFNSLDSNSFEKILGFIYKNEYLKSLRLSLFPPEEFFSSQMLLKLLFSLNYNYKSLFPHVETFSSFEEKNNDIDSLILNKLLDSFEVNLRRLFHLLSKKSQISELSLLLDIPSIIQNNELYMMTIVKFLFNIFVILGTSFNNFETLIIQAEYCSIDNRKNPFLHKFLNKLELYKWKISSLRNLTINIKFYEIYNIYNLITPNLTYLSIGSFDLETFQNFLLYITSSDYSITSKLIILQISLNNTILDFSSIYDLFILLFTQYPKSLKEITVISNIEINIDELTNLINVNNYNTLEKIILEFNKRSLRNREFNIEDNLDYSKDDIIENKKFNCYYINRNKKKVNTLLFVMHSLSKKYNKNFMNYYIFHSIEKHIFIKKEKELIIKYK